MKKDLSRLSSAGPKRILSIDGGGLRAAIALGFLERIEAVLRARHGDDGLVLADYFDLIGGTGTGAFQAALLATGASVAEVKDKFFSDLPGVFRQHPLGLLRVLLKKEMFDSSRLRGLLKDIFGKRTLGDPEMKTGLCLVTKRVETGETVALHNHPGDGEFEHRSGLLLGECVRAAMSPPGYLKHVVLDLGGGRKGAFMDGSVGMATDPALFLLLVATREQYPFRWATGADRLLLISVGTGRWEEADDYRDALKESQLRQMLRVVSIYWEDSRSLTQLMLSYLSQARAQAAQLGVLSGFASVIPETEALLNYRRYNVLLNETQLNTLGLVELAERGKPLRLAYDVKNRDDLYRVGQAAAGHRLTGVVGSHLPAAFDLNAEPVPDGAADRSPRPEPPRPARDVRTIFIAYHFGERDKELFEMVEDLVKSHGLFPADGEYLGGGNLTDDVFDEIRKADGLIALLTRRAKLEGSDKWVTYDWAQGELNFARERGMRCIAVLEEGIEPAGPYANERHRINFNREAPEKMLLALSHTLHRWKTRRVEEQ